MMIKELKRLSDTLKEPDNKKYFTNTQNDVPEHVKNYGKYNKVYQCKESKLKAWF